MPAPYPFRTKPEFVDALRWAGLPEVPPPEPERPADPDLPDDPEAPEYAEAVEQHEAALEQWRQDLDEWQAWEPTREWPLGIDPAEGTGHPLATIDDLDAWGAPVWPSEDGTQLLLGDDTVVEPGAWVVRCDDGGCWHVVDHDTFALGYEPGR